MGFGSPKAGLKPPFCWLGGGAGGHPTAPQHHCGSGCAGWGHAEPPSPPPQRGQCRQHPASAGTGMRSKRGGHSVPGGFWAPGSVPCTRGLPGGEGGVSGLCRGCPHGGLTPAPLSLPQGIAVELLRGSASAGADLDVGRARHDRPALHPLPGPLRRLQFRPGLRHHHRARLPAPRGGAGALGGGGRDGMGRDPRLMGQGPLRLMGCAEQGRTPGAEAVTGCVPPRQVQDVVKCQVGGCRGEENENSPDSCKNGQVQILVSAAAPARSGAGPPCTPCCSRGCPRCIHFPASLSLSLFFSSPPLSLCLPFSPSFCVFIDRF